MQSIWGLLLFSLKLFHIIWIRTMTKKIGVKVVMSRLKISLNFCRRLNFSENFICFLMKENWHFARPFSIKSEGEGWKMRSVSLRIRENENEYGFWGGSGLDTSACWGQLPVCAVSRGIFAKSLALVLLIMLTQSFPPSYRQLSDPPCIGSHSFMAYLWPYRTVSHIINIQYASVSFRMETKIIMLYLKLSLFSKRI